MIDLRSDTVTKPTAPMRQAMADAEVGDDVFGGDPTVNELERMTADLLGKEAAMFVPSGTMANQLAVRLHTQSGDEVLLETGAHIYGNEAGAAAAISGVSIRTIPGQRGIFSAADVLALLRSANVHYPPTTLVCVENTHNVGGGAVWPLATLAELSAAVKKRGIKLHMDGARLWNASVASGIPESKFAGLCDSAAVCYSKSLGAPLGSALVGSADFIARGRRFRKMMGGGMRQAGIVAAGALYALKHNRGRLAEDHENAAALARGLADIRGTEIDVPGVQTNIVRFRMPGADAKSIANRLSEREILLFATGKDSFRAVLHLEISKENVKSVLAAISEVAAGG